MEDYPGNPGGKNAKIQSFLTHVRNIDLYGRLILYHCSALALIQAIPN